MLKHFGVAVGFIVALAFMISLSGNAQTTGEKTVKGGYAPVNGLKMYYEVHGEVAALRFRLCALMTSPRRNASLRD